MLDTAFFLSFAAFLLPRTPFVKTGPPSRSIILTIAATSDGACAVSAFHWLPDGWPGAPHTPPFSNIYLTHNMANGVSAPGSGTDDALRLSDSTAHPEGANSQGPPERMEGSSQQALPTPLQPRSNRPIPGRETRRFSPTSAGGAVAASVSRPTTCSLGDACGRSRSRSCRGVSGKPVSGSTYERQPSDCYSKTRATRAVLTFLRGTKVGRTVTLAPPEEEEQKGPEEFELWPNEAEGQVENGSEAGPRPP